MAYKKSIREFARSLRGKGFTYSEIFSETGMKFSKSTISLWCKDVPLPPWYSDKVEKLNRINLQKAQVLSRASQRQAHTDLLSNLKANNKHLKEYCTDKNVLRLVLSMLYLGEGAKWKSHRGLMLGSSDPRIVVLYIQLLNACYAIGAKSLKCRISYRADQDIEQLQIYWSDITGIPLENFYKTKPDARTVGVPTKQKSYKGVCVIMCAGTYIQLELDIISGLILESLAGGPIA